MLESEELAALGRIDAPQPEAVGLDVERLPIDHRGGAGRLIALAQRLRLGRCAESQEEGGGYENRPEGAHEAAHADPRQGGWRSQTCHLAFPRKDPRRTTAQTHNIRTFV